MFHWYWKLLRSKRLKVWVLDLKLAACEYLIETGLLLSSMMWSELNADPETINSRVAENADKCRIFGFVFKITYMGITTTPHTKILIW